MSETISLLSKNTSYVGEQNQFASLGILQVRGDKYMVFMNLEDGKVYIEEVFATHALGDYIVGFKQVEDDKVWSMLVYAANSYGLTSQEHITACIKELNPKKTPAVKAILKGKAPK